MPHEDVAFYKNLFSGMKALRSNWQDIWTDIDRYVYGFVGSYDSNPVKGQLTYENVYDQTAINANIDATNALVGILWQQGGRSIKITPANELKGKADVEEWFKKQSEKFIGVLDDPNARLMSTLTEYMESELSHGSAAVGVFRGSSAALKFRPYHVRNLFFQDNDEGLADTLAIRTWLETYKVVEKYGIDNVSPKVRKDFESPTQRNNEVEVTHFILPNPTDADRPIKSIHIDMQNNHIMKDSFYEELPIKVGRLYKTSFETYGRCPAVNTLANIKRVNAVTGDFLEATEKLGRPALGLYSDATVGNGVIDLSAGAVNVFNTQATDGQPIFPINDIGDLNTSLLLIENLQRSITEAYHINKLIDMNNDAQLTATEALILDRIRNTSLGALLSRQINEVFTPLIETSFNLLFNDGFFGVIEGSEQFNIDIVKQQLTGLPVSIEVVPEAIAKAYEAGEPIYKVEYLTPAARMLASEEANNIVEAGRVVGEMAQVNPAILDNIDGDAAARKFFDLKGLSDILKPQQDVEAVRAARAELQEQQLQQQEEAQQVATAANASQIQEQ